MSEDLLKLFTTRMRQLILKMREVQTENDHLRETLSQQKEEIKALKGQLADAKRDYDNLMIGKMLEITDGDLDYAKRRIQKAIGKVNKAISLIRS